MLSPSYRRSYRPDPSLTLLTLSPLTLSLPWQVFQGVTTEITSSWESGDDGKAVLFCRTTTLGKDDVCDQRSRVVADPLDSGAPKQLMVDTRLTKHPGAPTIVYTRVYEPLLEEAS